MQLIEDTVAAGFDASMALFDAFNKAMRRTYGRMSTEAVPEVLDGHSQFRLVVLDRQNVIGAAIPDRLAMLASVPVASVVTVQPVRARMQSSSGIVVLLLDFSAVARCPSTSPAPAAKTETRCSTVASTPPERRMVLLSMATTSAPSAGITLLTYCRKADSN
jgi:hypothetical protein